MSVWTTVSYPAVALYDSATMTAFGPVFRTGEEARHFLLYVRAQTGMDVRKIPPSALRHLHGEWITVALDPETRNLSDGARAAVTEMT